MIADENDHDPETITTVDENEIQIATGGGTGITTAAAAAVVVVAGVIEEEVATPLPEAATIRDVEMMCHIEPIIRTDVPHQ